MSVEKTPKPPVAKKSYVPSEERPGIVDIFVEKAISRKFLTWLTATGLMLANAGLDADGWVTISAIYIGGQSVVDAVVRLRGR
jgi:hypothetical protein